MAWNQQDPAPTGSTTEIGTQQPSLGDAQIAALLGAVEDQLTRHFTAMSARVDAVRQTGDERQAQLISTFQQQVDGLTAELERSERAREGHEPALQAAIEGRLTEIAASQNWRFGEVESRLERLSEEITLGLPTQMEAATIPLQQRFDRTTDLLTNRIEELQNAARRFDEQSSTVVQHVNDTSAALTRRIDDSAHTFSERLDERTKALSQRVDDAVGGVRQHVSEQVASFGRRIEATENNVIDRALAMEERINEQTGVRLAGVEATLGRVSAGIDDAIGALSHRVIELENTIKDMDSRMADVAAQVASVDQDAIDRLREQMSSAVGESMLVRIELERVASSTGEQFDKLNIRLAEVVAEFAGSALDISTAIQLERLEEIERALVELDPDQFVRKSRESEPATTAQDAEVPHPQPTVTESPTESNLSSW